MTCIDCGAATKVVDSVPDGDIRFRKRKCTKCGVMFYTVEDLVPYTMDNRLKKALYNKHYGKGKETC